MGKKYQITILSHWGTPFLLSADDIANRCGIHPHAVEYLTSLGLIDPENRTSPFYYRPHVVGRIQHILRLRYGLGINYNAAGVVLDLLDRIEELESRLRRFEE